MKKSLSLLLFGVLIISCKSDDDPVDKFPSKFTISIFETGFNYAIINWSESIDPNGNLISYDLYLDGQFITRKTQDLSFRFDSLTENQDYEIEIIAINEIGRRTSVSFVFSTKKNQPPLDFKIIETGNSLQNPIEIVIKWEKAIDPEGGKVKYNIFLNGSEYRCCLSLLEINIPFSGLNIDGYIEAYDERNESTRSPFTYTNQYPAIDEDVTLTSQEEVNSFGDAGYKIILGRLDIKENSPGNIINLSSLQNIIQVTKGLSIWNNTALTNLTGLDNLTNDLFNVEENLFANLYLVNNPLLENIEALQNLRNVTGIEITDTGVKSLKGLDNIRNAYSIEIADNDYLENITNLLTLGDGEIEGHIIIKNNSSLKIISGFNNIKVLDQAPGFITRPSIEITNNRALEIITGFSGENMQINNLIKISDNQKLTTINGFWGINILDTQFSGSAHIINNPKLTNLLGFMGKMRGGLVLKNNGALEQIDAAFFGLISGALEIEDNANLRTINGLKNYETGNGLISIENNLRLQSLKGFESLVNYSFENELGISQFNITNNDGLISLDGLSNCIRLGAFRVSGNDSLADFCDINPSAPGVLSSISGNLYNPTFQDLTDGNCSF